MFDMQYQEAAKTAGFPLLFFYTRRYEFYLEKTCELESLSCGLEADLSCALQKNKPVCTQVSQEGYKSCLYLVQP